MKNYLRLRASRRNTINDVIAFGGECCCLGTQSCKTIKQKYLMTDFAQAFQNDHNNISDTVERDQSAASQVIPSHSAKSHDFFWYTFFFEEFIRKVHFHLPLYALTLFRTSQKPPQASVKTYLRIKIFLFEIWRFHHSFLMRYFKMRIKTGWWKPSYLLYIVLSVACSDSFICHFMTFVLSFYFSIDHSLVWSFCHSSYSILFVCSVFCSIYQSICLVIGLSFTR